MVNRILTIAISLIITIGATAQTAQNNLGFESWTQTSLGEPTPSGFASINAVENTSDPIEGNSALKLQTAYHSIAQDTMGVSASGTIGGTGFSIGEPYSANPDSVTGFIRFNLPNDDTAAVLFQITSYDGGQDSSYIVSQASAFFGGSLSTWSKIKLDFVPVNGSLTPDSIRIAFTSESADDYLNLGIGTSTIGGVFEADGFQIHGGNQSLSSLEEDDSKVMAYPNPANTMVKFNFGRMNEAERLTVMDMTGKVVREVQVSRKVEEVSVSDLSEGLYIYQVTDGDGKTLATDKVNVVR